MNMQYIQNGQQKYKIDGVFSPNDKILPLNSSVLLVEAILNIKYDQGMSSVKRPSSGDQFSEAEWY